MELPHLGQHCSDSSCHRLDFLPVKCDGCNKIYCMDHYTYVGHNCPAAYKKNVQVPVCPLCNAPVPGKPDELPDIRVSRHIDADCSSDTAVTRRKKVFVNKCSLKGCKVKELVPVLCDRCNMNYCLKHRHPQDHSCNNITAKPVGRAGLAALGRIGQTSSSGGNPNSGGGSSNPRSLFASLTGSRPSNNPSRNVSSLQGNISEADALRMALEASLSGPGNPSTDPHMTNSGTALSQEQEDFLLAKALAESEMAAAGGAQNSTSRRQGQNCDIV